MRVPVSLCGYMSGQKRSQHGLSVVEQLLRLHLYVKREIPEKSPNLFPIDYLSVPSTFQVPELVLVVAAACSGCVQVALRMCVCVYPVEFYRKGCDKPAREYSRNFARHWILPSL